LRDSTRPPQTRYTSHFCAHKPRKLGVLPDRLESSQVFPVKDSRPDPTSVSCKPTQASADLPPAAYHVGCSNAAEKAEKAKKKPQQCLEMLACISNGVICCTRSALHCAKQFNVHTKTPRTSGQQVAHRGRHNTNPKHSPSAQFLYVTIDPVLSLWAKATVVFVANATVFVAKCSHVLVLP
jgi:hypothetical protein